MSRNSQTRRLALSVAVALSAGGGALFPVMPHAFAADVSGQTVTVDNPTNPQLTAPGISAGEISGWTDAGNVTNNTLTLSGVTYGFGNVHGGFTVGTGNVEGNKLFLKNGASINVGAWAVGGRTNNGGDATGNKIYIDDSGTGAGLYAVGGMTNGATGNAANNEASMTDGTASYLYGGFVFGANSTGNATGNKLTLSGGTVNRDAAGGVIQGPSATSQGKGDVSGSVVTISGGTVTGTTYGGLTQGIGSVTSNTVTVSGTTTVLHDVLGGRSMTGEVSGNILNFKEATADSLIGGRIAGTNAAGNVATNTVTVTSGTVNQDVRGGEIIAPTANGNVSGNKVNINNGTINGTVTAGYNMGTGKADGNEIHVANGSIAGVVTGGHSTQAGEVSGNTVEVTGGTLSDNIRGGFAYDGKASTNTVTITGGTLGGNTIVGGFSVNGTASGNTATVGTVAFTGNIMGGSAATGADTNKVFLKDNAAISGNAYGGLVGNGGAVTGNELTIEATGATVSSDAVGGQNNAAAGDVTDNKAYMRGGSVTNQLIGGMVAGVGATGKASGNRAEVSGGSSAFIAGALISDTGATGEASDNHAVVSGASAALGSIYGGITNGTGAAKDNTATISGSITANDVVGGQSVTGNAEGNKASFTQATVTNVRGARITGSGTGSAINNEATIAGGWVTGAAAGAEIQGAATGAVQDNTLTVTGGTVSGDSYGGITYGTGDAVHNGAVVSGGSTSLTNVYGGSAVSGSATKNYVTFADASAQSITAGRTGGAGAVSDNKVEMTSGSSVNGVTGGLSYGSGTVSGNKVEIKGGTVGGNILGGQNTGTGAASSNTVELTGGTINAAVYGSWANGAADDNTVTVKTNVNNSIVGGRGASASGNTVDLVGTVTVSGSVVGGQGSTASNNTVNLGTAHVMNAVTGGSGSATSSNKVNMAGSRVDGVITVGSAGGSGNTLTVSGENHAGNITGFQKAIFNLENTVNSGNAMLELTNGTSTNINWGTLDVTGTPPTRTPTGARTLLSNQATFNFMGTYTNGGTFKYETDKYEYFIDTDSHTALGAKQINLDEYQFRDAVVSKPADPAADIWAGRSKHGNTTQNNELTITGSGSTTKNAYGGWTSGTGTTHDEKNDSKNNKVNLEGGTLANVYGGYTDSAGGKATGNTVNVAGGNAANVVGGQSIGDATENTVNVTANFTGDITGGVSTAGAASGNTINLRANVAGNVTGGQGTATNDNKVNLEGITVGGIISAGNNATSGNTLTVKGANTAGNITGFQNLTFNVESATAAPMLTINGATTLDWNAIHPTEQKTGRIVLLQSNAGPTGLTFPNYLGARTDADETTEFNIDTDTHGGAAQQVISESYQFKGVTSPVSSGTPADVYGGISKVGNSTRENEITVSSGSYTNAYGGHTDGTGTAKDDKYNSYKNKITISGATTSVTGTVYGGYTTSVNGTDKGAATQNEVNVTGGTVNNVVGGSSAGDATKNTVTIGAAVTGDVTGGVSTAGAASDNTINLRANVAGNVTGGQGTATNDNKVNLEGITVGGIISAGNNATSGNTLTVSGNNRASNITGFQQLNFDAATADPTNPTNPMLNLTNGPSTTLDWNKIQLTSTQAGRFVLLQNTAGLSFNGTYTGLKTTNDADDKTEFNIDTDSPVTPTQVISESYKYRDQKDLVTPSFDPGSAYGGISKVGNSTRENEIAVSTGTYDNVYGGHTDGTGTAKDEKDNSYKNTVTLSGNANINDTVYGGYTTATTGKTWENTVNIEGGSAANVVGAKSAGNATRNTVNVTANYTGNVTGGISTAGIAEENTVNLDHVTVTGDVTGGQGATLANKNVVNMDNAAVTGTVKAAATIGAGNTLTVKGTNSAGNIAGVQQVNFNASGASSGATLLTLTDGAVTHLDWSAVETQNTSTNKINLLTHTNANNDKLLHIEHYTGVKTGRDTDDTTEFNVDTNTQEKDAQHIVSESYQYRGQTERVEMDENVDGNVYGGISKVGNATRENTIGVSSGTYTNAYGGYTDVPLNIGSDNAKSKEKGNSHDNTITVSGSADIGTVYGGYTKAASGTATKNTVNVTGGSAAKVVGAQSTGDATGNKVNISGGNVTNVIGSISTGGAASNNEITLSGGVTVDSVLGGQGTTTENNKVNLEGATVNGSVKGGSAVGAGHELTVKRANTVGSLVGFGKLTFDVGTAAANPMLTLNGGASAFDWQKLEVNGTTVDPVTLMENEAGISFSNYDGAKSKINSADTTEFNIDTENRTASDNKVIAQSYQYRGQTNAVTSIGTDVYGGISRVANATRENNITVSSGSYTNAYGGYTDSVPPLPGSDAKAHSAEKNNSHDNTITISGSANIGTVYGGYTNAVSGTATKNTVNVTGGTVANVVGGYSTGDAKENIVNVKSNVTGNVTGSVSANGAASANVVSLGNIKVEGNVTGGQGTATNDNKVNVDGTTVNGVISGGSNATSGNTLTVKGANSASDITGFQTVKFNLDTGDASKTMLSLTNGTATNIAWASLKTDGTATGARTLLSSEKTINLTGYEVGGNFVSETDAHEYFIDTDTHSDSDVKQINIDDYQFKGAKVSGAANSADTWAGRSKHGNTTQGNVLTITDGTGKNAYGGWTSGTGTANTDKNDSMNNTVNLKGGTLADVYGGYTTAGGKTTGNTVNVAGGNAANVVGGQSIGDATKNTVNVTAKFTGNVTGGVSTTGAASRNVVNLGAVTVDGNVTGGQGVMTDDNVIHLNKTTVKGDVIGGSAASGKGNTLVVHPGASTARSLAGLQDVQFYIDGTLDRTTPLLSLTTKNQDLRGVGFGIGVIDGAQPALRPNDRISLIRTASDGTLQTDSAIRNTSKAMQGVSLAYEFDLAQTAPGELSATVASAKLTEQTKSLVETRAGATAFINQGTDFLVSNNIQAAKTAAAAEKAEHADGYALWAGLGASNMRAETGSYVESKGWNLGIGWAREHEMDAGKIVYGPFVSYGNGTYDSYLDDNTHGSGKFRTLGLGLMARVDQNNGMWFEGSLQGGRAKSDYSGVIYSGTNSEYDVSSTYWAGHFGVGKNIQLKENETINPYLRYFWSHQAGSNATLKNNGRAGESYEFSSVSSQRIRLGFRYTNRNAADGEFYAGLALEYEFDGSANASYQGYSTLRPSLKGSSGMLELGYRFAPKDGNVTYDFSLAGWQGKRRGLSGDLGVKWMF